MQHNNTAESLETKHIEPSGKVVHGKKKVGFNDGENKQKSVHSAPQKDTVYFYAVYATKYWKAAGSNRNVLHVGRILEKKQHSYLLSSGLYRLHSSQYIHYPLEYMRKGRIVAQKQIRIVIFSPCSSHTM